MKLIIPIAEVKSALAAQHNVRTDEIEIQTDFNMAVPSAANAMEEIIRSYSRREFPNKIALIKSIRAFTGLGLCEAKNLMEKYAY